MTLPPGELAARRRRHLQRTSQYLSFGFDREAAARAVADAAAPLASPLHDVGTGRGMLAVELARRGFEVVSADPDAEAQEEAAFNAQDAGVEAAVWFVLSDAAFLPFDDGHFGGAFAMDALHHFTATEGVLSEMVRVVRPSGPLVLSDFTAEGFELVRRVHEAEGRDHPVGPASLDAARACLTRAGLRLHEDVVAHFHRTLVFQKA